MTDDTEGRYIASIIIGTLLTDHTDETTLLDLSFE